VNVRRAVATNYHLVIIINCTLAAACDFGGAFGKRDGGDAGEDGAASDAGADTGTGDAGTTDADAGAADAAPDGATADNTPPCLEGVFFSGGREVSARFNEAVEESSAEVVANYELRGSDNSLLALGSAQRTGPDVVKLGFAEGANLNTQLRSYELRVRNVRDLAGNPIDIACAKRPLRRPIYLNILWHQHQPLYLDTTAGGGEGEMQGPWVRKHATKDYFDMVAILRGYPGVHLNINLTTVLLSQLKLYLDRLGPFVTGNAVDAGAFLARWKGRTDPWIDLLLEPTPDPATATPREIGLFWKDPWSTVSTSDALMCRFPEYRTLRDKPRLSLTRDDWRALKVWFEIAWFDPDFLRGPVPMPDGSVVDLSDLLQRSTESICNRTQEVFRLKSQPSEAMANRLVAENLKVMRNVVRVHKDLQYNPATRLGQVELLTTPFFHPILPLVQDSDLARQGQPGDPLPARYSYPQDADAQVAKAVRFYKDTFGIAPRGMWPGEGSVAEAVVQHFARNGIRWVATGQEVLDRSRFGAPLYQPYRVDDDEDAALPPVAIAFRENWLSDRIGFEYQGYEPEAAAADFVNEVLKRAPGIADPDRLLTVVLDGENAWESYVKDHDAKGFHHALYRRLAQAQALGEIVTVTTSEYLDGNPARAVPAHPVAGLEELEPLFAGSWIGGTFSTWIGESEEAQGWSCLKRVRDDLAASGLPRPNPSAAAPSANGDPAVYSIWRAWESMYAAEGSDWFWWFGDDMITPANDDTPFDRGFRTHLSAVYTHMNAALPPERRVEPFACPVIIQESGKTPAGPFATAPTVDGVFTGGTESEWVSGGGFFNDADSGAANDPRDVIQKVYYGWTTDAFHLAVEARRDWRAQDMATVYFNQKTVTNSDTGEFTRNPTVPFNTATPNATPLPFKDEAGAARAYRWTSGAGQLLVTDGSGGWSAVTGATAQGAAQGKLLEVKAPFTDLKLRPGEDPLEFWVVVSEGTADHDVAPNGQTQIVFDDPTTRVFVTFEVDVSGAQVPLDKYGACCDVLPPPAGTGIVYIAGNHPRLGLEGTEWTPNLISLTEKSAGVWSISVPLDAQFWVRYKYTVGTPSHLGRWGGTEEFPVTRRGFVIEDKAGPGGTGAPNRRVHIKDVFADKPPAGQNDTLGSMSVLADP
jgi:alpha-amylase/alpha-mannosidase (GH57 family)